MELKKYPPKQFSVTLLEWTFRLEIICSGRLFSRVFHYLVLLYLMSFDSAFAEKLIFSFGLVSWSNLTSGLMTKARGVCVKLLCLGQQHALAISAHLIFPLELLRTFTLLHTHSVLCSSNQSHYGSWNVNEMTSDYSVKLWRPLNALSTFSIVSL